MLLLLKVEHFKLLTKEKELSLLKIAPPKALVDKERWKVSMFKSMYAAKMHALIEGIWLKRNCLTYVAKKLMILVVFVKSKCNSTWLASCSTTFTLD
jgi:hypothetical protein